MFYLQREISINDNLCLFKGDVSHCDFLDCVAEGCCKKGMKNELKELTYPVRLFVYGTLKKEFYNNNTLKGSKYVRQSRVNGILLHLGNYPGLLLESTATPVEGELWDVPDAEILARVDQLEGHPHCFERKKVRVAGGEEVYTYEYGWYYQVNESVKKTEGYRCVPGGTWYGQHSFAIPFLGFFKTDAKSVPKTSGAARAHIHIEGQFKGMIDCFTGQIVRDNWQATGKPHLIYDKDLDAWKLSGSTALADTRPSLPPLYVALPKSVVPAPTPYVDSSDPGEKDFEMRNVA